jgi:hypothetical protein
MDGVFSMADMGFEDPLPEGDEENDNDNNDDDGAGNGVPAGNEDEESRPTTTSELPPPVVPSATTTALGDSKDASRAATPSSTGTTPRQHVMFSDDVKDKERAPAFTPGTVYNPVTGEPIILTDEELELQRLAEQEKLEREAEEARARAEERARYVAEHCTTLKFRYIEPIGKGSLAHFLGTRDREVILEDRKMQSYADLQVEIAKLHPNSKHLFVCQYGDGSLLTSDNFITVSVYGVREAPLSTAALNRLQATFEYARLPTMWELESYTGWPKKKEEDEEEEQPKSEMDNILGDLLGRVRTSVHTSWGHCPCPRITSHPSRPSSFSFSNPRRCPRKHCGKRWKKRRLWPATRCHCPARPNQCAKSTWTRGRTRKTSARSGASPNGSETPGLSFTNQVLRLIYMLKRIQ